MEISKEINVLKSEGADPNKLVGGDSIFVIMYENSENFLLYLKELTKIGLNVKNIEEFMFSNLLMTSKDFWEIFNILIDLKKLFFKTFSGHSHFLFYFYFNIFILFFLHLKTPCVVVDSLIKKETATDLKNKMGVLLEKGVDLSLCFTDLEFNFLNQNLLIFPANYQVFKTTIKSYFNSLLRLFLVFRFLNNKGKYFLIFFNFFNFFLFSSKQP
jgi:hypothetical protein